MNQLDSGSKSKFLMCPPTHYDVAYERTPWTRQGHAVDQKLAETQWQGLYDWLTTTAGASVELMEPVKSLRDMVFTAQAGFLSEGHFFKSRFRQRDRQQDEVKIERWFRKKDYEVKTVAEPYFFEGEGDLLTMNGDLYAGYHFRAELESLENLALMMKRDHLALEIQDPLFYHLDTCLGPLDGRTALIYPGAFEAYAVLTLLEMVPDPILVSEEEALRWVCNSVCVEKQVLLPLGCVETRKVLEARGFEVTELDFSEYVKAGGASKSLVLRL